MVSVHSPTEKKNTRPLYWSQLRAPIHYNHHIAGKNLPREMCSIVRERGVVTCTNEWNEPLSLANKQQAASVVQHMFRPHIYIHGRISISRFPTLQRREGTSAVSIFNFAVCCQLQNSRNSIL